jgi:membrane protein implicated in regulation of membrane protease activity
MKFRVLFIIFNVVILVSFVLIFLMPAFVLGWEYTSVFWRSNWPVGAVFLVVLAALNAYFVYNWKVFRLLEEEDWHALIDYLEHSAFEKKQITRQRARILINAYVVTGQVDRIKRLEEFLRAEKPRFVPKLGVELGIPYLLSNDGEQIVGYFGALKDESGLTQPLWVRWCYAFGLMTQARYEEARAELTAVLQESRDPLLKALTAHMLEPFGSQDEATSQLVKETRESLRSQFTRDKLDRELERQRQHLQVLFLASRIEEARDWVFKS